MIGLYLTWRRREAAATFGYISVRQVYGPCGWRVSGNLLNLRKNQQTMRIAVYCSSRDNLPSQWRESAAAVGRWIGENGSELVYGGVDLGLMHTVADATRTAGGRITGVVPLRRADMAFAGNDVNIPTAELTDRKNVMQLLADVFVVLPGGYGTLDEFASAFAYINFGSLNHKQIVLFNPDGLFDHLVAQLNVMVERGLMSASLIDSLTVARDTDELLSALDNLKPTI